MCDVYLQNRFYQSFHSDELITTLVVYMLKVKSRGASTILDETLTINTKFHYQDAYTSRDYTHHYVNTTKFKLGVLHELLRLSDYKEKNCLLDMASGPCSNMKAHFGEKELRMVLDDGQQGMVIGRIQTYRHDCVGVNYHRILSLAIEQGKPAHDGHGNVKDFDLSKLVVTTE
jgi:hypothetical protein